MEIITKNLKLFLKLKKKIISLKILISQKNKFIYMNEIKNALIPSLSIQSSISNASFDHSDSLSINPFLVNNSMKKVRKFLEKSKKSSILDTDPRKSNRPTSPTLISINFLKKQDPFYKKICQSSDPELLEVTPP